MTSVIFTLASSVTLSALLVIGSDGLLVALGLQFLRCCLNVWMCVQHQVQFLRSELLSCGLNAWVPSQHDLQWATLSGSALLQPFAVNPDHLRMGSPVSFLGRISLFFVLCIVASPLGSD